jgi:undecaprenyl-diphosphatase
MDWIYMLQAVVLGIVEGLTEFLPVSSTGHLIVAADLVNFKGKGADTFVIAIQAGAILAVCWYYRERIAAVLRGLFSDKKQQNLAVNTIVAFLPAAVVGVMVSSLLKKYLFNPVTVAAALVIGGFIILWVERRQARLGIKPRVLEMDDMNAMDALKVGIAQCFSMIPGTSRSGATIIGGMIFGLSRKAATEFSFFLAIPTIFGATVWDLWKSRDLLTADGLPELAIGTAVSFFSALAVVHWLIRYVSGHDFRGFGWYRIFFGGVILITWATGIVAW